MNAPLPFQIAVPDTVLKDLQQRLDNIRWPDEPDEAGWAFGANLDYMQRLAAYWRDEYDWRAAEARINRFPQFTAPVAMPNGDPLDIHFIHVRGSGGNPLPLLLMHGWPGSIVEFLDVIEPLAHPERFGGDASDGFDVIAPSLPGFGFSGIPPVTLGPQAVGGMMSKLMRETLGYERYVAQGGDWGGIIAARIALDHPKALTALHVNILPLRPSTGPDDPPVTDEEAAWFAKVKKHLRQETAYQDIQATKPQTLAYGLMDSPIGLAGWIAEKFHGWTDPTVAEPPFPMDDLLTNIMVYWATGTINSSTRIYRGYREERCGNLATGQRVEQPLGLCLPPNDLFPPPPSSWVKRLGNVTHETRLEKGGHFTAMEVGKPFVEDVRSFFRTHR
ncbi:MAG: alpha/beta fold hydrolase [Alphaproteobacteria bacterium]|nr:alpha/beta fold hydrolase [Alphaproteobacteria bacterium]